MIKPWLNEEESDNKNLVDEEMELRRFERTAISCPPSHSLFTCCDRRITCLVVSIALSTLSLSPPSMDPKADYFGLLGNDSLNGAKDDDDDLEEGQIVDEKPNTEQEELVNLESFLNKYDKEESTKRMMENQKMCFVCKTRKSIYKCPKCGLKTCSSTCCVQHKKTFDCDGIRDQLSFVPMKDYKATHFDSGKLTNLFCYFVITLRDALICVVLV